ncbi:MAG: exodeoxyribonuclease III [Alphaproteobacteria bacterium]|nr:exodeoxyribonuclease III [Alphaproteobacteria bacterium]
MPVKESLPYLAARVPARPAATLRIATWNINSVRLRIELLRKLAKVSDADVICLQETKATNDVFPEKAIAAFGYPHQHYQGDKGYNGVAILSRVPLANPGRRLWAGREDSRHVEAVLPGGIELHCVYVPAGGDVPDPKANDKFAHKLAFLDHLAEYWGGADATARRVLVGDLNVAPLETDVWSHKQLLDVVSHTPPETTRFAKILTAHDWVDATRALHPEPQPIFTWWSYRNRDWRASDRGRRLDHVWVSRPLAKSVRAVFVLKGARDWPQGSDHVPVIVDLVAA